MAKGDDGYGHLRRIMGESHEHEAMAGSVIPIAPGGNKPDGDAPKPPKGGPKAR